MSRQRGRRSASLFYIFAEGAVTEKKYFEKNTFGEEPRPDRKYPVINKGHREGQDPKNMMKWVEKETSGLLKKGDTVWILIDKDENAPNGLLELKEWCEKRGFRMALSNPMFEYWLALHFQYIKERTDQPLLEKCLSNNLGCKYDKRGCYNEMLSPRTDAAIKNAERARKDVETDRYCDHNPFTNVDLLIEDIRRYLTNGR
jgi:hypothetical protein